MLKHNNNKRKITIAIGILVAIVITLTSFGPSMAEGTSESMTSFLPEFHLPDVNFKKLVKILYHL